MKFKNENAGRFPLILDRKSTGQNNPPVAQLPRRKFYSVCGPARLPANAV
ncbi:MAG: hypothetical protein AVDCRST_MAG56-6858 [uncultured Cytophagales bacterium]|uniref:Uncharacterized protein n=1 Tax=uncultured Cytophagales bacterium TaxID=158755 RepID=A0A6J4L1R0_9SPHI|nr:MAG: hypothetical protein AVDCRST_MAG56-6858 [uncultured Cytophagales bacterium]